MLIKKLQTTFMNHAICLICYNPSTSFMTSFVSSSSTKLSEQDLEIISCHSQAVCTNQDFYEDPTTKFAVFTRNYHLKRGKCCGSACRHVSEIKAAFMHHKLKTIVFN